MHVGATTRNGGRKPINAKCETVHKLPMFKEALSAQPPHSQNVHLGSKGDMAL
jgi:hypothetical protein